MTNGMFALLLAGALVVPHVTPALGTDAPWAWGTPLPRKQMAEACSFRLSPISTRCNGWIRALAARKSIP
jgi:hypothetical protein